MHPILSAGLLIGVLCGVWTFVMGFTGWYKDPTMTNAFFVVILIEIGGLYWGLKRTAAEGRSYGGQVIAGTMMAAIAGIVIVASSLLFTTLAFPDHLSEMEAAQRQMLAAGGKSPSEVDADMQASAAMRTPMAQAMTGFVGTLLTGIIASAVIAIWVKGSGQAHRRSI